jgi:hypothetical protein
MPLLPSAFSPRPRVSPSPRLLLPPHANPLHLDTHP